METNKPDLTTFYTEAYLTPPQAPITEGTNNQSKTVVQEKKFAKKGAPKKGKSTTNKERTHGALSDEEQGEIYNDSTNFLSHFDRILEQFGEDFGADDSAGDAGSGDEFGGEDSYDFNAEEDEQVSVSKASLQAIYDQLGELLGLNAGEGEDGEFGLEGGDIGDEFGGDEVPTESYTNGAQGNYDGKAKTQGKSSLVKGNGDAEFGKQDTGFAPEDTEGREGSEHGDQGEYDGKAKTQGKTNLVQSNGNANVGKTQKTGHGKQEKQALF